MGRPEERKREGKEAKAGLDFSKAKDNFPIPVT